MASPGRSCQDMIPRAGAVRFGSRPLPGGGTDGRHVPDTCTRAARGNPGKDAGGMGVQVKCMHPSAGFLSGFTRARARTPWGSPSGREDLRRARGVADPSDPSPVSDFRLLISVSP